MSGDDVGSSGEVVRLTGTAMARLVGAIPVVEQSTGRPVILVGGLAVMCRLTGAYRATTDLDGVDRHAVSASSQLELLIASGARHSGPSGALVATPLGQVQVDLLEVTDDDLARLSDDPNDRLHVLSHSWAAETAAEMTIAADTVQCSLRVALPGPLIAMKLHSLMNRRMEKEATDLLDITRLLLDRDAGRQALGQLSAADATLRADAWLHADQWFGTRIARSLRLVHSIPEGRDLDLDVLRLGHDLLRTALTE